MRNNGDFRIGFFLFIIILGIFSRPANINAACDEEREIRRMEFQLQDKDLPRMAQFVLYLPPCYDANRSSPYPLLILLHGHDMTLETWDELGLPSALRSYAEMKENEPFLALTILETDNLLSLSNSGFDRTILEKIVPWVESHFYTGGRRELRALGGISRGAFWAADIAFRKPETAQTIGLHSIPGSPFSDIEFHYLIQNANESGETFNIRFDIGDRDPNRLHSQALEQQLTRENVPFQSVILPGDHVFAYWQENLTDYLQWYGSAFAQGIPVSALGSFAK